MVAPSRGSLTRQLWHQEQRGDVVRLFVAVSLLGLLQTGAATAQVLSAPGSRLLIEGRSATFQNFVQVWKVVDGEVDVGQSGRGDGHDQVLCNAQPSLRPHPKLFAKPGQADRHPITDS